jgi:hypothetical protein
VLSTPAAFGHDPEFWPRLGTWVRSTREARLTKREEQWKAKNNRKKIAPAERTRFAHNLAPTSLFDCFWRMRIKSNYGTIDPYLVNHISESEHQISPGRSAPSRARLSRCWSCSSCGGRARPSSPRSPPS